MYRIQRDIPMPLVTSGVDKGNLRELALARMAALGLRCRCGGGGGGEGREGLSSRAQQSWR